MNILSDIGLYPIKDLCVDLLSRISTSSLWMDSFSQHRIWMPSWRNSPESHHIVIH